MEDIFSGIGGIMEMAKIAKLYNAFIKVIHNPGASKNYAVKLLQNTAYKYMTENSPQLKRMLFGVLDSSSVNNLQLSIITNTS